MNLSRSALFWNTAVETLQTKLRMSQGETDCCLVHMHRDRSCENLFHTDVL